MSIGLKNACFNIWKTTFERKGIQSEFKPLFTRFIGVENINEYNNVLKTLQIKFEQNKDNCISFDGEIPLEANFDLINSVKKELQTMNINDIEHQDIVLFADPELNSLFLRALAYSVKLAISNENFFNESQRNNFIMKLIMWTFTYLSPLKIDTHSVPKCLYYGNISKHEIYFLILLSKIDFDVLYINPLKEEFWSDIDKDGLSELHKNNQILQVETYKSRCSQGNEIQYTESSTLQFEREIQDELFTGTGVYRSWQFRDGTTKAVFVNSSIIDVDNNWNEMAKVRTGFTTQGKTVTVPYFFHLIDGEYRNLSEYSNLVHKLSKADNTLFLLNGDLGVPAPYNNEDKFQLTFCMLSNGLLNLEEVQKLDFYKYKKYKPEVQNFILNKINETISDNSLFTNSLTKDSKLDLMMLLLNLDERIIRQIDSFDFTEYVPKLTIFLENENELKDDILYLIAFLSKVGFDIVIFNPSGLFNLSTIINPERYNSERLDTVKYDRTYDSLKLKDKKGFLNKLFK